MGEPVALPAAQDLPGHLVDRADQHERRVEQIVGADGVLEPLGERGGGACPIVGLDDRLEQGVPLDVLDPVAGPCPRERDTVVGLGRGGDAERPRWLPRQLDGAGDAQDVGVGGGDGEDPVAGASDDQGGP